MEGREICRLIPQRAPIMMVDAVMEIGEKEARTGLLVEKENLFCKEGRMMETGLIEHVAQSAAAFVGYPNYREGRNPKLGFIGEIKRCSVYALPCVGERLETRIEALGEAAGVTLISAVTICGERKMMECQMKLFLKND